MVTFKSDKPYAKSDLIKRLGVLLFACSIPVIFSLFIQGIKLQTSYYIIAFILLIAFFIEKSRVKRVDEIAFDNEKRQIVIRFQSILFEPLVIFLSYDKVEFQSLNFPEKKRLILNVFKNNHKITSLEPQKDGFELETINEIIVLIWSLNLSITSG